MSFGIFQMTQSQQQQLQRRREEKNKAATAAHTHTHTCIRTIKSIPLTNVFDISQTFGVGCFFLSSSFVCLFAALLRIHTQNLPMKMCNQGSTHRIIYIVVYSFNVRPLVCSYIFALVCAHVHMHTHTHIHARSHARTQL